MENIEIKARCADLVHAAKVAADLGAYHSGVLHQIDTYFVVSEGRLKLREINGEESQLVFYQRPNASGPKSSHYQIHPIENPADLKQMLAAALGIWKVVEKHRQLYLFDEVRIHLDEVAGLGSFLELEGVVSENVAREETAGKVRKLMQHLAIVPDDLVELSYSDLVD